MLTYCEHCYCLELSICQQFLQLTCMTIRRFFNFPELNIRNPIKFLDELSVKFVIIWIRFWNRIQIGSSWMNVSDDLFSHTFDRMYSRSFLRLLRRTRSWNGLLLLLNAKGLLAFKVDGGLLLSNQFCLSLCYSFRTWNEFFEGLFVLSCCNGQKNWK